MLLWRAKIPDSWLPTIRSDLGAVLVARDGYAAADVREVYARALELAKETRGDDDED